MTRLGRGVLVAALVAGLVLPGAPAKIQAQGEFLMLVNNQPRNIDPAKASSNPEFEIMRAAYEALLDFDVDTKKLVPTLASGWTSNPEKTQFTFTLRPGVKFHDGSTLTADGVKMAYERVLQINRGESYLIKDVARIDTPNATTVVFTLKNPQPEFPFAVTRIFVPSPKALADHRGEPNWGEAWFNENEAGSGPYRLTVWEREQRIVLERFSEYWRGWSGRHVDRFVLRVVAEPGTQRLIMERGEADFADSIVTEDAKKLEGNARLSVESYPGNPMYITINPARPPLNDPRVRRAIALVFDYSAMLRHVMEGYALQLPGPVPASWWAVNSALPPLSKDIEAARKLLAEAGNPLPGRRFSYMYFEPWLFERNAALILLAGLQRLGLNYSLEIEAAPWATFTQKVANPQTRPDFGMIAVYTPTPSPGPLLRPMYHSGSQGHWAYWGYRNPTFDALLDRAEQTLDDNQRARLYREAQKIVYDDQASIFVMQKPDIFVFRKGVKGLKYSVFWGLILSYYTMYKE